MIDFVEYLNLPEKAALILVAGYLVLLVVGAILDLKKKAVPEFMNVRKFFARKKQERETLAEVKTTLDAVKKQLSEVNAHYSADNITKRNDWMSWVNNKAETYDTSIASLTEKLDKNNSMLLAIRIDNMRSEIINFAACVIDDNYPATHEQFNRMFKLYGEYEDILEQNKLTNGEANVAIRIINEAYETRMRKHSFVEETRWREHNLLEG